MELWPVTEMAMFPVGITACMREEVSLMGVRRFVRPNWGDSTSVCSTYEEENAVQSRSSHIPRPYTLYALKLEGTPNGEERR